MSRFGLKTKLVAGFGTLLTLLVLLGASSYYAVLRVAVATEAANSSLQEKHLAAMTENAFLRAIRLANDQIFNGDAVSLRRYETEKAETRARLSELKRTLTSDKALALLTSLQNAGEHALRMDDKAIALRRASRSYEATTLAFSPEMEAAMRDITNAATQLETVEDQLAQDSLAVEHQMQQRANHITITLVSLGLVLGLLTTALIGRSITVGISRMLIMIQQVAERNLTIEDIETGTDDEIGKACLALNQMKNNLCEMIVAIAATAERVASASEEIAVSTTRSAESAETQSRQADQVSGAIEELAVTVQLVEEHSRKAGAMSLKSAEVARAGADVVDETLSAIRHIASSSRDNAVRVTDLGASSRQITKIVAVIQDIADQTNLLALNAAIEAARAGEQGRGFAVVADEVRKLAERTTSATEEISVTVKSIQSETQNAVDAMEHESRDVEAGVEKTAASGAVLKEIMQMSAEVDSAITQITDAARTQLDAASQAGSSIQQISNLVRESSASAQETASACNDLSRLAANLRQMVNRFTLPSHGARKSPPHRAPHTSPHARAAAAGQ
jgi:methyl-accepting chemotaxis protein